MRNPRPFYRYLWTGLALVFLLALFLVFQTASEARAARPLSDGGWLPAAAGLQPSEPNARAVSSSSQQIELSFSFSGVQAEIEQLAGVSYTRLSGLELGSTALPGQPELPFLSRAVQIPLQASYSLEITASQYREVSLVELGLPEGIFPAQLPQSKSGPRVPLTAPEVTAYATDAWLPAQPAAVGEEFIQRGRRGLNIELHPVQYNPARGTLRIYSRMDVTIQLKGGDAALTRQLAQRYASPEFEDLQAASLLNYGLPGAEATQLKAPPPGYLIISANSYVAGLAPFVALKQSQGFEVTLASLTDVGGTTSTAIKTYIQNFYVANPSLVYLLLVGDMLDGDDSLPDSTDTSTTTDLYYATMDGSTDTVADIFYGRFPVRDTTQLANMVNKAIAYQSVTGSEAWVKKAAFIGTSDTTWYPVAEGTHNYVIDSYTAPLGYTGIFPANPQPGGDKLYAITYSALPTHVITSIDDGRSMVVYSGHGNTTSWAGPAITQANVRSLLADDIYPYVAGHACLTGKWDVEESFAETWVIQPDQGALVYFGASNNTYWNEDDVLERSIFDNLYGSSQPSVGAMTQFGLMEVNSKYPDRGLYYRIIYHVFGDPSVKLVLGARDFSLAVDPEEIQVCSAGQTTAVVNLTSLNSFANMVDLSLSEKPAGISGLFDPAQVRPTGSSLLTLTDDGSLAPGSYPLRVQAVSGEISHSQDLTLTVTPLLLADPDLLSPEDGAVEEWIFPVFTWEPVAGAVSYYFELDDADDFATPLLQVSLTETSYTPAAPLPGASSYFWRVLAKNDCGETFSTVFDFSTTSASPLYLFLPTITK